MGYYSPGGRIIPIGDTEPLFFTIEDIEEMEYLRKDHFRRLEKLE